MDEKTTYVFYGNMYQAAAWAIMKRIPKKQIVLWSNPHQLRGLLGPIREVYAGDWGDTRFTDADLEQLDEIRENIRIINAMRKK